MIEINTSRKGKKNRMKSHYRSQDAYKYYKSRYGNPHNLTQGMYGSIFKDFIEAVTDKMLFENALQTDCLSVRIAIRHSTKIFL